MESDFRGKLWLLAPLRHAQGLRQSLEQCSSLDKQDKVVRGCELERFVVALELHVAHDSLAAVPTSLEVSASPSWPSRAELSLPPKLQDVVQKHEAIPAIKKRGMGPGHEPKRQHQSVIQKAILEWLHDLPAHIKARLPHTAEELCNGSWSFQVYHPMLLLSASAFQSAPWQNCKTVLHEQLPRLYQLLCSRTRTTHLAINAPIPPHFTPSTTNPHSTSNTLRSPTALQPLHGSFGPPDDPASARGFARALWVSARQNGVQQVFAPRHTMFARGNVKEKLRVAGFPGLGAPGGTTAVDLYAGVGYFAFAYAKAGAARVLCWELNPWSVEGFQRGAARNRWRARIWRGGEEAGRGEDGGADAADVELWMFPEDNAEALSRIERLRDRIPPVRHVNCGYLPSSKDVWQDALAMLDPGTGGWIHAHENVKVSDIAERATQIEELMSQWDGKGKTGSRLVRCEHVEKVKSFAPGVVHCVFDVHVGEVPNTN